MRNSKNEATAKDDAPAKPPKGEPVLPVKENHSQDADRHQGIKHPVSKK